MFTRSPKTLKLETLFRSANGELSYAAITAHMGESLDELRSTITNVRHYLERDEGIVFETVRGVGYKRLTDAEKVESTAKFTRRIRRTAIRGSTRVTAADMAALSPADQLRATVAKTLFDAIQRETGEKK